MTVCFITALVERRVAAELVRMAQEPPVTELESMEAE